MSWGFSPSRISLSRPWRSSAARRRASAPLSPRCSAASCRAVQYQRPGGPASPSTLLPSRRRPRPWPACRMGILARRSCRAGMPDLLIAICRAGTPNLQRPSCDAPNLRNSSRPVASGGGYSGTSGLAGARPSPDCVRCTARHGTDAPRPARSGRSFPVARWSRNRRPPG